MEKNKLNHSNLIYPDGSTWNYRMFDILYRADWRPQYKTDGEAAHALISQLDEETDEKTETERIRKWRAGEAKPRTITLADKIAHIMIAPNGELRYIKHLESYSDDVLKWIRGYYWGKSYKEYEGERNILNYIISFDCDFFRFWQRLLEKYKITYPYFTGWDRGMPMKTFEEIYYGLLKNCNFCSSERRIIKKGYQKIKNILSATISKSIEIQLNCMGEEIIRFVLDGTTNNVALGWLMTVSNFKYTAFETKKVKNIKKDAKEVIVFDYYDVTVGEQFLGLNFGTYEEDIRPLFTYQVPFWSRMIRIYDADYPQGRNEEIFI